MKLLLLIDFLIIDITYIFKLKLDKKNHFKDKSKVDEKDNVKENDIDKDKEKDIDIGKQNSKI